MFFFFCCVALFGRSGGQVLCRALCWPCYHFPLFFCFLVVDWSCFAVLLSIVTSLTQSLLFDYVLVFLCFLFGQVDRCCVALWVELTASVPRPPAWPPGRPAHSQVAKICIFLLLQFWPIFARIRIFEAQISWALEILAMFVEQGVEVQVTWSQIFCEMKQ